MASHHAGVVAATETRVLAGAVSSLKESGRLAADMASREALVSLGVNLGQAFDSLVLVENGRQVDLCHQCPHRYAALLSTTIPTGAETVTFDPAAEAVLITVPIGTEASVLAGVVPLRPVVDDDISLGFLPESVRVVIGKGADPSLFAHSPAAAVSAIEVAGLIVPIGVVELEGIPVAARAIPFGMAVMLVGLGSSIFLLRASEKRIEAEAVSRARTVWDVPLGVFIASIDGRLRSANDAYLAMFGFESLDAALDSDERVLWQSNLDRAGLIETLVRMGKVDGFEAELTRLDGSEFPGKIWVRLEPETGELRGVVEDVTGGRAARLSLEVAKDRFESLFDFSPIALQMIDATEAFEMTRNLVAEAGDDMASYLESHPDQLETILSLTRVITSNEAATELFGADRSALTGTLSRVPRIEAGAAVVAAVLGGLASGSLHQSYEGVVTKPDGEERRVEGRFIVPRSGGLPDFGRIAAAYTDVTDREEARRAAIELSDLKSKLIASVSHELRTPLTAVVGFSDILDARRDELSPEAAEMATMIAATSRQMTGIVEDLLASVRADIGDLAVAPQLIDLAVEAAASLTTVDLDGNEVAVDGEGVWAWADRGRVRQIVRNMVSNAVRHGAGPVRIRVCADPDWSSLQVIDHGAGVKVKDEPHIFEPYWTTGGTTGHTESVGLGLNLSRHLARYMGGDLGYRRIGDETVFELTLPARNPVEATDL